TGTRRDRWNERFDRRRGLIAGLQEIDASALLGADVHSHANAVAGVVVGAGDVLAAGIFVGHVVGHHRAVVGIGAVGILAAVAIAPGFRIADGDVAVAVAAVGVVDAATGGAADHRTDRGADHLAAAVTDPAAQHRAGDPAEHGGDQAPAVVTRPAMGFVAVVAAIAVAVAVSIPVAVGIARRVAVAAGPALATVVHRLAAAVEDRVHAQDAGPFVVPLFVASLFVATLRRMPVGAWPRRAVVGDGIAMAVVAVRRRAIAVVVRLRGRGACGARQRGGKADPRGRHRLVPAPGQGGARPRSGF